MSWLSFISFCYENADVPCMWYVWYWFLVRDTAATAYMLSMLYAIVRPSVHPSIRLSVTWVNQSKTVEVRIMQFSPYSSPIHLVFTRATLCVERVLATATCLAGCPSRHSRYQSKRKQLVSWFLHRLIAHWYRSLTRYDSSKNSQGVTPSEGDLWEWGGFERAIFFTLHICLSEPTTKIRMNIAPYCQQQKCSPGIAVATEVKFVRIFLGVRWGGGVKWEWGRFFLRFSTICRNISKTVYSRQSYYRTLIGNHMQAIDWCHFRWPWVTPDPDFKVTVFFDVKYLENVAR